MKRKRIRKNLDRISYQEAVDALSGRTVRARFVALSPTSTIVRSLRHSGRTRPWLTFEVRTKRGKQHYIATRPNSRRNGIVSLHFDQWQMQRCLDGALRDTLRLYGMTMHWSQDGAILVRKAGQVLELKPVASRRHPAAPDQAIEAG